MRFQARNFSRKKLKLKFFFNDKKFANILDKTSRRSILPKKKMLTDR